MVTMVEWQLDITSRFKWFLNLFSSFENFPKIVERYFSTDVSYLKYYGQFNISKMQLKISAALSCISYNMLIIHKLNLWCATSLDCFCLTYQFLLFVKKNGLAKRDYTHFFILDLELQKISSNNATPWANFSAVSL